MNYVLVKINKNKGKRNDKMKKIITNKTLYKFPENLDSAVPYSAETLIDNYEWYRLENFSEKEYCLPHLKSYNDSTSYPMLEVNESNLIQYICSCQNTDEYYFQKVPKKYLSAKKWIHIGDEFVIHEDVKNITINTTPDAFYHKKNDILYFQKLEAITSIFNGIEVLYKEASTEETTEFLKNDFILLSNGFSSDKVKKTNRKRIALAIKALNEYDHDQRGMVLESIRNYCGELLINGDKFKISNEQDLEILTYGIMQRFYTTADGRKKLIANSIKNFKS